MVLTDFPGSTDLPCLSIMCSSLPLSAQSRTGQQQTGRAEKRGEGQTSSGRQPRQDWHQNQAKRGSRQLGKQGKIH